MKRTLLALTSVAVLALSGCGGDGAGSGGGGLSSDEQTVADNLSKTLREEEGGTISVSQKEADCIGEDMATGVGVEKLQEYGIVKDDLSINKNPNEVTMSTGDAETAADAFLGCTDVQAMIDQGIGEQLAGQPPAVKKCFEEALTDERVRSILVGTFSGKQQQAQQELVKPVMECAQKAMGGLPSPEGQ